MEKKIIEYKSDDLGGEAYLKVMVSGIVETEKIKLRTVLNEYGFKVALKSDIMTGTIKGNRDKIIDALMNVQDDGYYL